MNTVERYYNILELEPGDSLEEINQAYRDLAFVWHPDRYGHNPRLQQKAHQKLQQLNEAREYFRLYQPVPVRSASPASVPFSRPVDSPPREQGYTTHREYTAHRVAHTGWHSRYGYSREVDPWLD